MYLIDNDEMYFFFQWLALPHPIIQISRLIEEATTGGLTPPLTPELEARIAAKITPEQESRFSLIVRRTKSRDGLEGSEDGG